MTSNEFTKLMNNIRKNPDISNPNIKPVIDTGKKRLSSLMDISTSFINDNCTTLTIDEILPVTNMTQLALIILAKLNPLQDNEVREKLANFYSKMFRIKKPFSISSDDERIYIKCINTKLLKIYTVTLWLCDTKVKTYYNETLVELLRQNTFFADRHNLNLYGKCLPIEFTYNNIYNQKSMYNVYINKIVPEMTSEKIINFINELNSMSDASIIRDIIEHTTTIDESIINYNELCILRGHSFWYRKHSNVVIVNVKTGDLIFGKCTKYHLYDINPESIIYKYLYSIDLEEEIVFRGMFNTYCNKYMSDTLYSIAGSILDQSMMLDMDSYPYRSSYFKRLERKYNFKTMKEFVDIVMSEIKYPDIVTSKLGDYISIANYPHFKFDVIDNVNYITVEYSIDRLSYITSENKKEARDILINTLLKYQDLLIKTGKDMITKTKQTYLTGSDVTFHDIKFGRLVMFGLKVKVTYTF